MSDIDRKAIANYFKPFPKWAVWCIVIGVALLFTDEQSSVVIGIILMALPGLAWDLALSRIEIQPSEVEEHVILEALPVSVAA